MKHWLGKLFVLALLLTVAAHGSAAADPSRVLILANKSLPDSVSLAHYYATARSIPEANIIALPLPKAETISWETYVEQIHNPLREWLNANRWLTDANPETDPQGRRRGRVLGHRIDYLVLCKGVPLRISENKALGTEEARGEFARLIGVREGAAGLDRRSGFGHMLHSYASVDSELAALPTNDNPVFGWVPNPTYGQENPFASDLVRLIKVSRLDGLTYKDARAMIDSALKAERFGLRGRAYIDKGGPYPLGNTWLDAVETALRKAGWQVVVDNQTGTFPSTTRFDAPALYFGWYTQFINGPFTEPGFRFPAGAVAMHLHSYSASSLENERNWTPGLIARGAAATVGNVYEPTLGLTHNFGTLAERLMDDWTWGDAVWCATPALSWQSVMLGDPLYQPMKLPLKGQAALLDSPENQILGQYVVLREISELVEAGKATEALELGKREFAKQPGYALALELAQMQEGEPDAAVSQLAFMKSMGATTPAEAGIALDAARFLAKIGRETDALALLDALAKRPVSPDFATATRELAVAIASKVGDIRAIERWRQ